MSDTPVLVTRWNEKNICTAVLYCDHSLQIWADKLVGKRRRELGTAPGNCELCEYYMQQVLTQEKKEIFQLYIQEVCYQAIYLPEWDEAGRATGVLSILWDITQMQQTRGNMIHRQLQLTMAQEIAQLGYFEWNTITRQFYWSDQQFRNFGYSPKAVVPSLELVQTLVYPADWDRVKAAAAAAGSRNGCQEYEIRVVRTDRTFGWLQVRMQNVVDDQGCCLKIFGTTQDITLRKQAEERINRVERELIFTNQLYNRSTCLNQLIDQDCTPEQALQILNELGISTQLEYCCFALQLSGKQAHEAVVSPQAVLIWLVEQEWGVTWKYREEIILLLAIREVQITSGEEQIDFALHLIDELRQMFYSIEVRIGISGVSGVPVNIDKQYRQAHRAVITAVLNGLAVVCYDNIGLYELAFQLSEDSNTYDKVQKTLGRLEDYDRSHGTDLLYTLECILEETSLKDVALNLYIHHNTAIWRKKRIEKILGMSLDRMENRALIMMYLKIWKIKEKI